jgi:hypothetical protein
MDEEFYINKIKELEKENNELKERLKNYTAPKRSKKYYENHKDVILAKVKEYKAKTNYDANLSKDKKKEYNKNAYQKRKEKMLQNAEINANI